MELFKKNKSGMLSETSCGRLL